MTKNAVTNLRRWAIALFCVPIALALLLRLSGIHGYLPGWLMTVIIFATIGAGWIVLVMSIKLRLTDLRRPGQPG